MSWDTNYDDWKLSAPDTEPDQEIFEEEFDNWRDLFLTEDVIFILSPILMKH